MKKVAIIILNYKNSKDTIECVESLEKINYKNFNIIIVDNDSKDDSVEILRNHFKDKHIILNSGKNGGFAYGNNIGIKYALENGADYVLLINNDTIVEDDFLNVLVETAEKDKGVAIATGLIMNYYDKSKIWYNGGEIDWNKFYGYHLNERENFNVISEEKEITFATGCLMLIRKDIFKNIGFLSEEYFMYYEDVDFCAKVQNKGYKIVYNSNSKIYHKVSASSGEEESPFAIEWNTRNRLRFYRKYKKISKGKMKIMFPYFFYSTRILKGAKYLVHGRLDKVISMKNGLINKAPLN